MFRGGGRKVRVYGGRQGEFDKRWGRDNSRSRPNFVDRFVWIVQHIFSPSRAKNEKHLSTFRLEILRRQANHGTLGSRRYGITTALRPNECLVYCLCFAMLPMTINRLLPRRGHQQMLRLPIDRGRNHWRRFRNGRTYVLQRKQLIHCYLTRPLSVVRTVF